MSILIFEDRHINTDVPSKNNDQGYSPTALIWLKNENIKKWTQQKEETTKTENDNKCKREKDKREKGKKLTKIKIQKFKKRKR